MYCSVIGASKSLFDFTLVAQYVPMFLFSCTFLCKEICVAVCFFGIKLTMLLQLYSCKCVSDIELLL